MECFLLINICLILDGHGSHVTLKATEQAQDFGLDMITFTISYITCSTTIKCVLFQAIWNNIQKG